MDTLLGSFFLSHPAACLLSARFGRRRRPLGKVDSSQNRFLFFLICELSLLARLPRSVS